MNGDILVASVRNKLQDEQTMTDLGYFWSDREIALALNNAQSLVFNFLIDNKEFGYLMRLAKYQIYTTNIDLLPLDYAHYIAAQGSPTDITTGINLNDTLDILRQALLPNLNNRIPFQIYLGGVAGSFLNVNHNGCFIINNNVYFNTLNVITDYILYYFCYPSKIGLTSLGDSLFPWFANVDFPQNVYDLIEDLSVTLLGFKEPQQQRDVKLFKNVIDRLQLKIQKTTQYTISSDSPFEIIQEVEKQ